MTATQHQDGPVALVKNQCLIVLQRVLNETRSVRRVREKVRRNLLEICHTRNGPGCEDTGRNLHRLRAGAQLHASAFQRFPALRHADRSKLPLFLEYLREKAEGCAKTGLGPISAINRDKPPV